MITKFVRNKKEGITPLILILMLTTSVFMASMPTSNAEVNLKNNAYLDAHPNPVGVNQLVVVNAWLAPAPPTATDIYHGFKITITKPNGNVETRTMDSQPHGGNFFTFKPDQVGTYRFQFTYPGEYFKSVGRNHAPATSPVTTLIVQNDFVATMLEVPPPTDYWTHPISAEHRGWWTISGNWLQRAYNGTSSAARLGIAAYNPYSQATGSSHIIWTKEFALGGLVGGEYNTKASYYGGGVYEYYLEPPVIMNGRLYYNVYHQNSPFQAFACVDIRTGEELWRIEDATIDAGQLWTYESLNMFGTISILWKLGSTYTMYDAFTGKYIAIFANASSGEIVRGQDGTMYVYVYNAARGWLAMWNSTKAFEKNGLISGGADIPGATNWSPKIGIYDWRKGIQWNTTNPIVQMKVDNTTYQASTFGGITDDVLLYFGGGPGQAEHRLHAGYSLTNGKLLWSFERPADADYGYGYRRVAGEGIYAQIDNIGMRYVAYDAKTGDKLWVSDPHVYPFGVYLGHNNRLIADGKLFSGAYDGHVLAFNTSNGKKLWDYYVGDSGIETPYGTWPLFGGFILVNGVLYTATNEHSAPLPLYRGQKLHAINATTGKGIWNITGMYVLKALAEGYLMTYNQYDNRIYSFGKGPSATTVSVPQNVIPKGTEVMITGTVTDQSSGAKGTPAMSDESMSNWMEYLYMQKPLPQKAKGVQVKLTAIDPNGNFQNIGVATSDIGGSYGIMWTPPVEGQYQVVATFEGSNSYGSSYATTYFGVSPAKASAPASPYVSSTPTQTTTPEMTPTPTLSPSPSQAVQPPTSEMPATTYIAIGAAVIIIVATAAALILRKRK